MYLEWLQRNRSLHQLAFDSEGENHDMTLVVTGSEEHWTTSMDCLGAPWNIWVCVCGTLEVPYGWYCVCMEHHGSPADI